MTIFSNKYFKIFTIVFSFYSNMISTQPSYSMADSLNMNLDERAELVKKLKTQMREELSYPEGLFSLLSMPREPMPTGLVKTQTEREDCLRAYHYNLRLNTFDQAAALMCREEMERIFPGDCSADEKYLEAFKKLILEGKNKDEISRRRPFIVFFAGTGFLYWQHRDIAWNILAPFRNLDDAKSGCNLKLNFLLSMAGDIFSSFSEREMALNQIDIQYYLDSDGQEKEKISFEERQRIEEVKKAFEEESSSSEILFTKCMERAMKTLHPAPWEEFRPQYRTDAVKLEMMLQVSGRFLKEILEDDKIDYHTRFNIADFLHDLAFRGNNPEVSGEKLSKIGNSYLKALSHNPNAPFDIRFNAIAKILNTSGYNDFSSQEKSDARHVLLDIGLQESTPSENRLRAFFYLSVYKDASIAENVIKEGYPLIERIFLNPQESIKIRQKASSFFTEKGSLYGVTHTNYIPYTFYHRPKERGERDRELLLSVIKDVGQPREFRKALVDYMPYGEKQALSREIEDTYFLSVLPYFNTEREDMKPK
ncbi:MAG: hypothetical protein JSS34_06040 [Proteobacteria bacterium]|nr:hypothetical protein [Pseudomonadota bacterium]